MFYDRPKQSTMKIIQIISLVLLIFQLSYSQTSEELNKQSKELLDKREFEKAIPILRKAAELGSGKAQYNLGYFLQYGVGTKKIRQKQFNGIKNHQIIISMVDIML